MSGRSQSLGAHTLGFVVPFLSSLVLGLSPASGAEGTVELGAGGLSIARNDVLEILSEEIVIAPNEVRTTYRVRNKGDKAATFLVAFPMPPLESADAEESVLVLPRPASDNFLDFQATADGKAVVPQLEQRVIALGVSRAADLQAKGLPLNPLAGSLPEKIAGLSAEERAGLHRLGLLVPDGSDWRAGWRLETTLSWQQLFPPGKEVTLEHRYKPVVGTGLFGTEDLRQGYYRTRFCTDADFFRVAGGRLAAARTSDMPYLDETRVAYALGASSGWTGAIRSFRLVVDKGDADAVVSFCGGGIRRISANQFELTARNYVPDREINVLIVKPRKAK
ncbi:MAG: DUF4424 family protein [Bauldia sp.]